MALIVQKYGGTSVADRERIANVAVKVRATREQGHDVIVVLSAMAGETDRLIALARSVCDQPSPRELDTMIATGEQLTVALLAMILCQNQCPARSYTGMQVGIHTDNTYNKARIITIDQQRIRSDLDAGRVVVVAGFQGVDEDNNITTLGRGGSDITAVALAARFQASECQIYTDVCGVYTSNPRIVPSARLLDYLTFEEMLEMASQGTKVLQIRAVEFANKYNVPLRVLSSFEDCAGTLIIPENKSMEQPLISGISCTRDEAKVTVLGVPDRPGIASSILGPIADAQIEVDMIVQNSSQDGNTDFTFTVHRDDYKKAREKISTVIATLNARGVIGDPHIAKISLVGIGMRSHAGIASRMFAALARENINIQMISTSEIKVSVVVDENYMELGTRVLHREFGLDDT